MRIAPTLMAIGIALAVATPAPSAWAQDDGNEEKTEEVDPKAKLLAKKLLAKGYQFLKKGDRYAKRRRTKKRAPAQYERALQAFNKAYEVFNSSQIYFAIAEAETKLERWLDAIKHYQLIVKDDKMPQAKKDAAKTKIGEISSNVVTLMMTVTPEGALVMVDGKEVGLAPLSDPVYLAPGEHTVAVTYNGFTPQEFTEAMEAGAPIEKTIELKRIPVVVKIPKKKPKKKKKKKKKKGPPKTTLIAGISATAGMGTLWMVFGLVARSKHSTFEDVTLSMSERESARDSGKTMALLSDLSLLATLGVGAYTAYYYYKVYKPKKRQMERRDRRRADRGLWIMPYAGARTGGVAAGGRF